MRTASDIGMATNDAGQRPGLSCHSQGEYVHEGSHETVLDPSIILF